MKNYAELPCDQCGCIPATLTLGQCSPCAETSGRGSLLHDVKEAEARRAAALRAAAEVEAEQRRQVEAKELAQLRAAAIADADGRTKGFFTRSRNLSRAGLRGWLDDMAQTGEVLSPDPESSDSPERTRSDHVVLGALWSAETAARHRFRRAASGFDAHMGTDAMSQANWQYVMARHTKGGGHSKELISQQFFRGDQIHVLVKDGDVERLATGRVVDSAGSRTARGEEPDFEWDYYSDDPYPGPPAIEIEVDGFPRTLICDPDDTSLLDKRTGRRWEWSLAPSCPKPSNPFPGDRYPDGW